VKNWLSSLWCYELTTRANDGLDRLTEFSVALSSAIGGVAQTRRSFRANVRDVLNQLRGPLASVRTENVSGQR
jgi:hypothetical protein